MRFHSTYDFLYLTLPLDIDILDLNLVGNAKPLLQRFLLPIGYLFMMLRLITSNSDKFFVREYNAFAIPIFRLAILIRKGIKIYVNVNHNFVDRTKYNAFLKSKLNINIVPVIFEFAEKDKPDIFFPILDSVKTPYKKIRPSKLKFGIVGKFREEKCIDVLLKQLVSAIKCGYIDSNNVEFILGTDCDCLESEQKKYIKFANTNKSSDYEELINYLDVAIFNYGDAYSFRTSGVVHDLIQRRKICIVPDHELLRHQVQWPVQVGYAYKDFEQLLTFIKDLASGNGFERLHDNYDLYLSRRSLDELKTRFLHYFL